MPNNTASANTPNTTVEFMVYGNNALFSDILTRAGGEKLTYPIPTYEAIKGILTSIYWKPTITWVVDSIRIMKPIRTVRKGIRTIKYNKNGKTDLSYYTYLNQVCYQVKAHFEWNYNQIEMAADRIVGKHMAIAKHAIQSGGRRDIFLGTRECQGYVEPCRFGSGEGYYDNSGDIPFGVMYHGMTYPDEAYLPKETGKLTLNLWKPVMTDGYLNFPRPDQCTMKRIIRDMPIQIFKDKKNNITISQKGDQ